MTKILHTDAFTQRDGLYTGMLLYTGAFTERCFSQRHAFTHRRLHLKMLLFGDASTRSYLYAQVLLHRDGFTQRSFCTQTRGCLYTQMPLHSNAFTQRNVYTHVLLHRKSFDTEYPLHREAFAQTLLRGFF